MRRSLFRSSLAALALATLAFAPMTAQADEVLAAQFPHLSNVPVSALPALGSVPTFYVNVDSSTMARLLRKDLDEGRRHFDKINPSHLDPHIIKVKDSPVGSASENGFSQGNSTICITAVLTYIPYYNALTANTSGVSAPGEFWSGVPV